MIHKGSCLCGQIRYEIHGEIADVMNCHCSNCRKYHGAAFRTRAWINTKDFRWISGEALLSQYESSPGCHRMFCNVCGSKLIARLEKHKERYSFALGTLDTDPGVKPASQCFVGSKAPWYDIADDLPQHQEFPR